MRVTADMMVGQSVRRLSKRMENYERIQQQVATGRKFSKPSEAPAEANTGMALRASLRSREQEQRAAADARSWLDIVDSQMQSAVERLHRLRNLAIGADDASLPPAARHGIATEMRAIQADLVNIANGRHAGRPLFGGFTDTDAVTGSPGSWALHDDGGHIMRVIGQSEEIRVNVTATEAFVFDSAAGPNDTTFAVIDDLVGAITGGASASGYLERIDAALDQMAAQQGRVGSVASQLEAATARNLDAELAIRTQLSTTEDVDVAEAMMELQLQQLGFEATLKAVGTALPPSLLNFI